MMIRSDLVALLVLAFVAASFFALGFVEPGVAQRVELRGWSATMPIFTFLVVAAYALIALLCCRCNAGAQRFACNSHQPTHRSTGAPASRWDTNPYRQASTRAQHGIASCARCATQVGA
jgi:hypothetical protein